MKVFKEEKKTKLSSKRKIHNNSKTDLRGGGEKEREKEKKIYRVLTGFPFYKYNPS